MCKLESRVFRGLEAVKSGEGGVGSQKQDKCGRPTALQNLRADRGARGAYLAGSDVTRPGRSPERVGPR